MSNRSVNVLLAALSGAVIAVTIGVLLSWAGIYAGWIKFSAPEDNPTALSFIQRAVFDLYAMQHVSLSGSGSVDTFAGVQQVSDAIVLPLTVWAIIPALALFIGGIAAAQMRTGAERWGVLGASILGGILYTAIMCLAALFIRARLDPAALPSIDDVSFNPHDIPFGPDLISTALSAGLFAVIFAYLGGMLVTRSERQLQPNPGQWWTCGKAVVLPALIFQLILASGAAMWMNGSPSDKLNVQITTIKPTLAGIAYSLLYGATLSGNIESPMQPEEGLAKAEVNIYTGLSVNNQEKALPTAVRLGGGLLAALMSLIAGALAVKWGARGGAVATAIKVVVLQALFLFVLAFLCRLGWSSAEGDSLYKFVIQLKIGIPALGGLVGVFATALLGSYLTNKYYVDRRGYV